MKNLSIITQGVMGSRPKEEKKGYVACFFGNYKILSVDNFTGQGDTYKMRETPIIVIYDEKFSVIFEGTHEQLIKQLLK